MAIQQEEVRLVDIAQLSLEWVGRWIVDIEVDEFDLVPVSRFEPVHDGRQPAAGRSPESEKLDQGGFPGGKIYTCRIGGRQLRPDRRSGWLCRYFRAGRWDVRSRLRRDRFLWIK